MLLFFMNELTLTELYQSPFVETRLQNSILWRLADSHTISPIRTWFQVTITMDHEHDEQAATMAMKRQLSVLLFLPKKKEAKTCG